MNILVSYYGQTRQLTGLQREQLQVEEGSTVETVIGALAEKYGQGFATLLIAGGAVTSDEVEVKSMNRITIESAIEMAPSIHPGGDRIVYSSGRPGERHLYYRLIEGGRPIRLIENSSQDENKPTFNHSCSIH